MTTNEQHALALQAKGADLDWLAARAVRIAAHRGYVTAGLANGTSIIAARYLGLIKRDRRFNEVRYTLTAAGKAAAQRMRK